MIGVLCGDPARTTDFFAAVGVDLDIDNELIYAKYARQWQNKPFGTVAMELKPIIKQRRPKFFGMETNYKGKDVLAAFNKAGIPAHGIATVGEITEEKRKYWQSMDKTYTTQWLRVKKEQHEIRFPQKPSDQMQILEQQVGEIGEFQTRSGNITYEGKKQHDDLFMAFLLCCHICRIYIERDKRDGP